MTERRKSAKAAAAKPPVESPGVSDSGKISLSGPQTIARIEETHATLVAAMTKATDLVVDCSDVTEADLTLVQVLLGARRDAESAGHRLTLAHPANGALAQTLLAAGFARPGSLPAAWIDAFWSGEH